MWYMVMMFSKCESDVLDGVSLQLSTPVVPVVHITPCTVALYRPQRDRRVSHLSLCLSPAKHSLSFFFFFQRRQPFSTSLYAVSIFSNCECITFEESNIKIRYSVLLDF